VGGGIEPLAEDTAHLPCPSTAVLHDVNFANVIATAANVIPSLRGIYSISRYTE
jgi:hypothetical protein